MGLETSLETETKYPVSITVCFSQVFRYIDSNDISLKSFAEMAGVTFSDFDHAPTLNFLNLNLVRKFFRFENATLVQTPASIDAIEIQQCFFLKDDMYKAGLRSWSIGVGHAARSRSWSSD